MIPGKYLRYFEPSVKCLKNNCVFNIQITTICFYGLYYEFWESLTEVRISSAKAFKAQI